MNNNDYREITEDEMCIRDRGYADYVVAMTSSHFASAEKQFRFPLEYANQLSLIHILDMNLMRLSPKIILQRM